MAEHSRSSGVFSRRLAVVNGGCCRPPARPRRYPVQSSLRRDPHTGVCVQVWCIGKKIGANRAPSPARRVCSGNDDLAFSLLSLCPPKVVVGASLVKGPGMHLANFFLHNHLHCLSQHLLLLLLLLPDHYLPLFCNRQKWPFG